MTTCEEKNFKRMIERLANGVEYSIERSATYE